MELSELLKREQRQGSYSSEVLFMITVMTFTQSAVKTLILWAGMSPPCSRLTLCSWPFVGHCDLECHASTWGTPGKESGLRIPEADIKAARRANIWNTSGQAAAGVECAHMYGHHCGDVTITNNTNRSLHPYIVSKLLQIVSIYLVPMIAGQTCHDCLKPIYTRLLCTHSDKAERERERQTIHLFQPPIGRADQMAKSSQGQHLRSL